jgi:hypothetical protein
MKGWVWIIIEPPQTSADRDWHQRKNQRERGCVAEFHGAGVNVPVSPPGPTIELSVQLVDVVEASIIPEAPAFGAALPLNCIAQMICFMMYLRRFVVAAQHDATFRKIRELA